MGMLTAIATITVTVDPNPITTTTNTNTNTATTTSVMAASLAGVFTLMFFLLLLLIVFVWVCRPWRFFLSSSLPSFSSSSSSSSSSLSAPLSSSRRLISAVKTDNLERPLLFEPGDNSSPSNDMPGSFPESPRIQIDENTTSPKDQVHVKQKQIQSIDSCASQGDSLVLDISNDPSQDFEIGSTLRCSAIPSWPVDAKTEIQSDFICDIKKHRNLVSAFADNKSLRSSLTLEVIAGPFQGVCCSRKSADTSILPLTLGRVAPNDLLLKDPEVSGKHANINWNINSRKWELVDKGSLNGTFLNSQVIHDQDVESRKWSVPVELADGDVITLGTSSKISVKISQYFECQIPYGVGLACDPMCARRGGKKLPMEDISCIQCPLMDVEQFGLFCIFDGHGGAGAAKSASQMLLDNVASILSKPERRMKVLSLSDASDILRDAFTWTEHAMTHQYEGCTATVLLIWFDKNKELFAQCANVGDSTCVMNVDEELIPMTEDHRVTSASERARLVKAGKPLKDGESRLCGLNLCRMLGDKFLKEQDDRFSSEPYISKVVPIKKTSTAFALMASDGLWDVISMKWAVKLVHQMKQKSKSDDPISADTIAKNVLSEARNLKTKDNTTVIFVDFDALRTDASCIIEV